jgi:futalosine hydrolase
MMTAYGIARYKAESKIDLAIQIGICGVFDKKFAIGQTLQITEDRFADLGAEDENGEMISSFDLGFADKSTFPYKNGCIGPLKSEFLQLSLPTASAITVNTTSGTQKTIDKWKAKFSPDVETMEGAAFYYATSIQDYPSIQIRTVSNDVAVRDKSKWNIPGALDELSNAVFRIIEGL